MPKYIVPVLYAEEIQLIWEVVEAATADEANDRAIKQRESKCEFGEKLFRYGGEPLDAAELRQMADNLEKTDDELHSGGD